MKWNPRDPKSFIAYLIVAGGDDDNLGPGAGCGFGCLALLLFAISVGVLIVAMAR